MFIWLSVECKHNFVYTLLTYFSEIRLMINIGVILRIGEIEKYILCRHTAF